MEHGKWEKRVWCLNFNFLSKVDIEVLGYVTNTDVLYPETFPGGRKRVIDANIDLEITYF